MKRILLLITDLKIGGTPTVVRELARRLSQAGGAEIEVACLAPWGPVADEIAKSDIHVTALNAESSLSFAVVVWRLVRLIRSRKIDTVFSFLVHANVAAAASSALCPGVHFLQSIQTTQPNPRWHWGVQAIAQERAERIVVPSVSVARVAREWASVPAEKMVVIPNAVDVQEFRGTGGPPVFSENTKATGGPPVPRVGFIGRLDPVKRISDLLEAVALLRNGDISHSSRLAAPLAGRFLQSGHSPTPSAQRSASGAAKRTLANDTHFPNASAQADPTEENKSVALHLHIFGEGADRARIEHAIRKLGLSDCVTLHGSVPRAQQALSQIDLLVLPSEAEGFGLVLIEAMAAGVPVVATNVPGIRDVVRCDETGLLVPPRCPIRLAEAIAALLSDPHRRENMAARAKQDVQTRFSWENVLPQYQRVLGINGASS